MRLFFSMLILALCQHSTLAQQYSETAQTAYRQVLKLDHDAFQMAIDSLEKDEPNNPVDAHLLNYWDFYQLFIHERAEEYTSKYKKKSERLKQIKIAGDPESPYYLYVQADIYLQWALVEAKFRDFFTAFRDIKRAYQLLEENRKRFPDFRLNDRNLGLLIALVGTFPDEYRWGFEWLSGIPGSLDEGQYRLQQALLDTSEEAEIFRDETRILYSLLLLHFLRDESAAWDLINKTDLHYLESDLLSYIMVNVALRTKQLDKARQYLNHRLEQKEIIKVPHLFYLDGLIKLYHGELAAARTSFGRFLERFEGVHYRKSSWLFISYTYYLQGNMESYDQARLQGLKNGDALLEEDRYAQAFFEEQNLPDKELLRIRLSFDGGNYDEAQKLIDHNQTRYPLGFKHKFITYYQARLYQETARPFKAIRKFEKVYALPDQEESYFAINAALQIGYIYIAEEEFQKATEWLEKCLNTRSQVYQGSIHQKAKAALLRCR